MVLFMVYDVKFFCLIFVEALVWHLLFCWISWPYSISCLCYSYPMLGDRILGRFLQPHCLTTFLHFESSLSFAMVSGCTGKPLWPTASSLHRVLILTLALASFEGNPLVVLYYFYGPSNLVCFMELLTYSLKCCPLGLFSMVFKEFYCMEPFFTCLLFCALLQLLVAQFALCHSWYLSY